MFLSVPTVCGGYLTYASFPKPPHRFCWSSPHPCFRGTQKKRPPPSSDDSGAEAEESDDAARDVGDTVQDDWTPPEEGGEEEEGATDVPATSRVTRATRPPVTSTELSEAGDKAYERDAANAGKSSSQEDGTADGAVVGPTNPKPVNKEDVMVNKPTGGKDPHIPIYLFSSSSTFSNSD